MLHRRERLLILNKAQSTVCGSQDTVRSPKHYIGKQPGPNTYNKNGCLALISEWIMESFLLVGFQIVPTRLLKVEHKKALEKLQLLPKKEVTTESGKKLVRIHGRKPLNSSTEINRDQCGPIDTPQTVPTFD